MDAVVKISDIGTGTGTTTAARNYARSMGNVNDDAGHAIGQNLGGLGGATSKNIFPQSPHYNRGAYRDFENAIVAEMRRTNQAASIQVKLIYGSKTGTRPIRIEYQATIGKNTLTQTFTN